MTGLGGPGPPSSVHLSVVVPVYRCRECLAELHRRLVRALEPLVPSFEVLLVNDGSPDGDWEVIEWLADGDRRVRGIDLSRNFGQHRALTAGLDRARGKWTVVMDCDLQHPPEELARLYRVACEGHDIVIGRRASRRDPLPRRAAARLFSWLHALLTGTRYDSNISNFSIISRPVLHAVRRLRERDRAYTSLLHRVGVDVAVIDFEHADRFAGRSSYGLGDLASFALESLASNPDRPLRLWAGLGFVLVTGSILTAIGLACGILTGVDVPGRAWTLVALCLLAGLPLVKLGIPGPRFGRFREQGRDQPLYVVRRTVNTDSPFAEGDGPS